MKATYQWESADTSYLSETPILRAGEVSRCYQNLQLRDHSSRKFPLRGYLHGASDMQWL